MDRKDETNRREDEVLVIIRKIVSMASGGEYIYRGQSDATHSQVTSTLYRVQYRNLEKHHSEGGDDEGLNMNLVQEEELKIARKYTSENYNDEEMLSRIQHYAGDTNLIDFTRDYLVALFFACSQKSGDEGGEDGMVFLLEIPELEKKGSEIKIITPVHPPNRVITQKSVFVQSSTGIISNDMMGFVLIPRGLKQSILDYLKMYHGISEYTIYNDLHGYIRDRKAHVNAVRKLHQGIASGYKSDNAQLVEEKNDALKKAIKYFDKATQLNPNYALAYYNRGLAKGKLDDLKGAISDYDKAIALDSNLAIAYNNRGLIKRESGDLKGAISDYDKAIVSDSNFVRAYINRGKAKEELGDRQNLQEALFNWENLEKLALKKNDHNTAKFAQQEIERVTAKIAGMGKP